MATSQRTRPSLIGAGNGRALVVFDADDTLWFTEPLYDTARDACRSIVEANGFDGEAWENWERQIDVANVARFGLSKERFPTSCVEAYFEIAGKRARSDVAAAVAVTAKRVFAEPAPLAVGVPDVLQELGNDFRLVLLTQGDAEVQERRIHDARLQSIFSQVRIIERKTIETFRQLLAEDGRPAGSTWSVGNSLASDINPALRLGMNAIWIPARVWEYENREFVPEPGRLFRARDLAHVRNILLMH